MGVCPCAEMLPPIKAPSLRFFMAKPLRLRVNISNLHFLTTLFMKREEEVQKMKMSTSKVKSYYFFVRRTPRPKKVKFEDVEKCYLIFQGPPPPRNVIDIAVAPSFLMLRDMLNLVLERLVPKCASTVDCFQLSKNRTKNLPSVFQQLTITTNVDQQKTSEHSRGFKHTKK